MGVGVLGMRVEGGGEYGGGGDGWPRVMVWEKKRSDGLRTS